MRFIAAFLRRGATFDFGFSIFDFGFVVFVRFVVRAARVLRRLDYGLLPRDNVMMVVPGKVKDGVVVLEGGPKLPDGTPVVGQKDYQTEKSPAQVFRSFQKKFVT